jgi:hypothetical protein
MIDVLITVNDAIDSYMDGLAELFDEMHWHGGLNYKRALAYLERCAKDDGYTLTYEDDCEDLIYEAYQVTEKGLS